MQSKHPLLLFLGLAFGPLMIGIYFFAIGIAIEPMSKALAMRVTSLQWLITAYSIGSCSFQVAGGKSADLYGHKKIFIISLLLFTLSSLYIGLSSSVIGIIIARIIQGASGGVIPAVAFAIIMLLYPPHERTKWIGGLIGASGLGMILGSYLGGYLVHLFNWRALFFLHLPIGILGLVFAALYIPHLQHHASKEKKIDWRGIGLLTATLILFTVGISEGHYWGFTHIKTLLVFLSFILFALLFLFLEKRSDHPLLDYSLFKVPNFASASFSGFFCYFCLTAWILIFGIYMQRVMGMTPLQAGINFAPFGIVATVISILMKKIAGRFTNKQLILGGIFCYLLCFVGLAFVPIHPSHLTLQLLFALFGLGWIILNSACVPAALEYIDAPKMGLASAKSTMIRWLGGAFGSAIMSVVLLSNSIHDDYHHGLVISMIVLSILSLLALITFSVLLKEKNRELL